MAITKEQILAKVNKEMDREYVIDDIKEEMTEALVDLSRKGNFLWREAARDTQIGTKYYSTPDNYRDKLVIKIGSNLPLKKITFSEYQYYIANETEDNQGEPVVYAIQGDFFYLYPTPDEVYTITLYYSCFVLEVENIEGVDADAVDNITFKDIYRKALNTKTLAEVCKTLELKKDAAAYEAEYLQLIIPELQSLLPKEPKFTRFNDI